MRYGPLELQRKVDVSGRGFQAYADTFFNRWPRYAKVFSFGCVLIHVLRRVAAFIRNMKIRACHAKLLFLLRMWDQVMLTVNEAKKRKVKSFVDLVPAPHNRDYEEKLKTTSRQLMEQVPYPANAYLHDWSNGKMWWLKFGIDILFSAYGSGWALSAYAPGQARMLVTMSAAAVMIPYFIVHPYRAATYACGNCCHTHAYLY